MALITALTGVAIWLHNSLSISLLFATAFFVLGLIFLLISIKTKGYGCLGSDPKLWLTEHFTDYKKLSNPCTAMLAYIARDYASRIDATKNSNAMKSMWIDRAIFSGMAAPVILSVSYLFVRHFS